MEQQTKKRLTFFIIVIIIFTILSFFLATFMSLFMDIDPLGNVAVISVRGVIRVDSASGFGTESASSTEITKQIEKAAENPMIEAIVFDINSPGGSAVASQEIADAIEKSNKTTVAVIREVGASGGYWIASATDYIIANEMSITGSIGVIGSYIEFAGLLERYNMSYQRLVGGKYKDLGTPLKPLGVEERNLLQSKIDKIHDIFVRNVAINREMSYEKVKEISTGEFYLGVEALELGLIDATGNRETAAEYLRQKLNITNIEFAEYEKKRTIIDALSGVLSPQSFQIGRGIGAELKQTESKLEIWT